MYAVGGAANTRYRCCELENIRGDMAGAASAIPDRYGACDGFEVIAQRIAAGNDSLERDDELPAVL